MKVFISSTAYDLLDARAELAQMLREMGITLVLSDDKLSGFLVKPDANSIECCLHNLRGCDEVVVLISQRYGADLEKEGFGSISATHLEYLEAKKKGIPVRFYVRDRTAGEYSTWRRNPTGTSTKFAWTKDLKVFEFIHEHQPLDAKSEVSNFYDTFTSSVDLKAAVQKYFRPKLINKTLAEALNNNTFPVLNVETSIRECSATATSSGRKVCLNNEVINIGGAPAFHLRIHWRDNLTEPHMSTAFLPSQRLTMQLICHNWRPNDPGYEAILCAEYSSLIGVRVHDEFLVSLKTIASQTCSGAVLHSRRWTHAEQIAIGVEEL